MATSKIPTSTTLSNYSINVELDGVEYILKYFYNSREDAWYYDILDVGGSVIHHGIKAVSNFPMLRLSSDLRGPPGELMAIDTTETGIEATRENLGTDVSFVYMDQADWNSFAP
jgi:hypothetical protein